MCFFDPACSSGGGGTAEDCTNGVDDDGNGMTDCDDFMCFFDPACSSGGGTGGGEAHCLNGIDDDGDGDVDCADSDCSFDGCCLVMQVFPYECDCTDGIDNDNNGAIDCQDLAAPGRLGRFSGATCEPDDGLDDDGGLIDCADSDCP